MDLSMGLLRTFAFAPWMAVLALLLTVPVWHPSVAAPADIGGAIPDTMTRLEAYARPGTLVRAPGGRKLNVRCIGHGGPAVILTAGGGEQSLTWRSLQAGLARHGRVCAWDRAGFGFSDPSPSDQDVDHRTDDLEQILKGAGIKPPYVLVGHSLGSFETLMFAFRHREAVAGIVLIDPSSPGQDQRLKRAAPAFYAIVDKFQKGWIAGLEKCISGANGKAVIRDEQCLASPPEEYPRELRETLRRIDSGSENKRNHLSLLRSMFSGADTRQLRSAWRSLGKIPITVLTAGAPPAIPVDGAAKEEIPLMQAEWSKMHDEIAQLSSRGVNRAVPGATHYIYLDQPKIVLDAIEELRSSARAGDRVGARRTN
jgi:pimeloyl-ACP methyl ester carboxylesterase